MSFRNLKTKKSRKEFIREKLSVDFNWASRGLIRIYENQTNDEQNSEDVKHNNGIGFTPADGPFLTSLAKQFQTRKFLSPKQTSLLHKKMPKYAGQLERFSEGVK